MRTLRAKPTGCPKRTHAETPATKPTHTTQHIPSRVRVVLLAGGGAAATPLCLCICDLAVLCKFCVRDAFAAAAAVGCLLG